MITAASCFNFAGCHRMYNDEKPESLRALWKRKEKSNEHGSLIDYGISIAESQTPKHWILTGRKDNNLAGIYIHIPYCNRCRPACKKVYVYKFRPSCYLFCLL